MWFARLCCCLGEIRNPASHLQNKLNLCSPSQAPWNPFESAQGASNSICRIASAVPWNPRWPLLGDVLKNLNAVIISDSNIKRPDPPECFFILHGLIIIRPLICQYSLQISLCVASVVSHSSAGTHPSNAVLSKLNRSHLKSCATSKSLYFFWWSASSFEVGKAEGHGPAKPKLPQCWAVPINSWRSATAPSFHVL